MRRGTLDTRYSQTAGWVQWPKVPWLFDGCLYATLSFTRDHGLPIGLSSAVPGPFQRRNLVFLQELSGCLWWVTRSTILQEHHAAVDDHVQFQLLFEQFDALGSMHGGVRWNKIQTSSGIARGGIRLGGYYIVATLSFSGTRDPPPPHTHTHTHTHTLTHTPIYLAKLPTSSTDARQCTFVWVIVRLHDFINQNNSSWTGFNIQIRDQLQVLADTIVCCQLWMFLLPMFQMCIRSFASPSLLNNVKAIAVVMDQTLFTKTTEVASCWWWKTFI